MQVSETTFFLHTYPQNGIMMCGKMTFFEEQEYDFTFT